MNFIDAKVVEKDENIALVFEGDTIILPKDKADELKNKGYVGKEVIMGIRPENITDNEEVIAANKDAVIKAKVEVTELMGAETYIYLAKGKANMTVRLNGSSKAKAGDEFVMALDTNKIHVFDKESELTVL